MTEDNPTGTDFQRNIKALIDSSVAYYKLWLFRAIAKSATSVVKILMVTLMAILALVLLSVAGALAIGYALDNFAIGFLIVGVFYTILCIVLFRCMDAIVDRRIIEKFSEHFKD